MSFQDLVDELIADKERIPVTVDTARFEDPLTEIVDWTPLITGGTNMTTHRLKRLSHQRISFVVTPKSMLFPFTFVLLGVLLPTMFYLGNRTEATAFVVSCLMGLLFVAAGIFVLFHWCVPRIFDKNYHYYWRGFRKPTDDPYRDKSAPLDEIYALQVIKEQCISRSRNGGTRRTYFSYELNLVLKTGDRLNVTDHGGYEALRKDAQVLSEFLGCPLWDAVAEI